MRLFLSTEHFNKVEVTKPFEPRVDFKTGEQRRDKQGGTGLPLWACQVAVYTSEGAEVLLVTVPGQEVPAELKQEQRVRLVGLEAMPYSSKSGDPRVAYRAESVIPESGKSMSSVKAAS